MASNYVSGRLSKLTQEVDYEMEITSSPDCPETALWLAVIERAICDYSLPTQGLTAFFQVDLHRFFFEDTPKPYNLVYICNMLFERDDVVRTIRERLRKINPEEKPVRMHRRP
jgi:hypothetical protein